MNIPTLSKNQDPALRRMDRAIEVFVFVFVFVATTLVCCSCGSTKVATQTIRDVSTDTIYLSNVQYDSIYIYQDKLVDRSHDTVYLKDVSIEYRYKLLRDTVKVIQHDSIPYEVTITQVKEITRPLTWFDHLTRSVFWAVFVIVFVFVFVFVAKPIIRFIRKIRFTLL